MAPERRRRRETGGAEASASDQVAPEPARADGAEPAQADGPVPAAAVEGDASGVETLFAEDPASSADAAARPGKRPRRGWSGTRLVALIAGVAAVSLLAGVAIMQFVVSPADLAARTAPPETGPVTAPIEQRTIENTIVTRAEITYADAVEATIDTGGLTERAVVTGQVPEVGKVLNAGDVALEIAGRPVLVLPGDLPVYRSLSVGMRGPDVLQLKQALSELGFWAGDLASDVYEADTAWAVAAAYERVGYTAETGGDEAQQALRQAERAVRDAGVALAQAQAALNQATEAEAPDVSGEVAAVNAANDGLLDAQEMLADAQVAVMPSLPAGEVLFLAGLPRRVDDVRVKRGDVLQGAAMTVSGATLTIRGSVAQQDAELLEPGTVAYFDGPDGELQATVSRVEAPQGGSGGSGAEAEAEGGASGGGGQSAGGRYTVFLDPSDLTEEQIGALQGTNVRLNIPVASTDGEVLAVPIAALSAGSGGENRVELLLDEPKGGESTELVTVTAGLAADGYVEISSDDPRIATGAQVVVGR